MDDFKDEIFIRKNNIKDDLIDQDDSSKTNNHSAKDSLKSSVDMPLINPVNTSYLSGFEEDLDTVIWKKLKKGDMEALGALYDLYIDEMYAFGMKKVYDKTHVMDSIHDLFVDLYKYRSTLNIPQNVKYYLLKSLKRKIYKKQFSTQNISLEDSIEAIKLNSSISREEEIIDAEQFIERKDKLKSSLTFLTTKQQKALHLRYVENLEYDVIAKTMNISIASTRTLVYRALMVLRKHYVSLVLIKFYVFF